VGNGVIRLKKLKKVFYIWLKTKTIENLFIYLDTFSNFLPILFFIFYWKRNKPDLGLTIITVHTLISFIINYLIIIYSNKITFLYESFTPIEYLFFSAFLYLTIKNKNIRKYIIGLSILFIIFLIFFYLANKKNTLVIDSVPIGIETILILIYCFYYLYEQMNDVSTMFIYNKYSFWIILGMVIYLSGSFFIYVFANQFSKEINQYWFITNILSILKNIFFAIAIYLNAIDTSKKKFSSIQYNGIELN
jgi:hypothetical protein